MRTGSRKVTRNRKTSGTPPDAEIRGKGRGTGARKPGKYRPKTGGGAPYRDRKPEGEYSKDKPRFNREGGKPEGERPARKPYGDRPYSKPGASSGRSFRKPDVEYSKDKPRFNREGGKPEGERTARKPYGDRPYSKSGASSGRSFRKPDGEFSKDKPRFSREGGKPYGTRPGGFKKPFRKFSGEGKPDNSPDDSTAKPGEEKSYRGSKPFSGTGDRKSYGDKRRSFGKPYGEKREGYKRPFTKSGEGNSSEAPGGESKWNRKEKHEFYGDRKRRPRTFSKPEVNAEPKVDDGTIRLNKYISNAGICSRREADDLISTGVISVNGNIITTLGYKVQPGDVVRYNDARLKSEKPVYLLLNKPKDYITTVDDPQNRQTVMSLIKHACKERVYPVGRLDRNTTGLLLFTNDGDLADKLTHPSFEVQKVYEVHLDKNLKNEHFEEIGNGVTLEDGVIRPDEISYSPDDKSIIGIELHSGRNRIVRRIFEHFGYRISKLDRVLYAGLTKKDLPRGKFRFLTEMELANLKMITGNKRFKAAPKRIAMAEE